MDSCSTKGQTVISSTARVGCGAQPSPLAPWPPRHDPHDKTTTGLLLSCLTQLRVCQLSTQSRLASRAVTALPVLVHDITSTDLCPTMVTCRAVALCHQRTSDGVRTSSASPHHEHSLQVTRRRIHGLSSLQTLGCTSTMNRGHNSTRRLPREGRKNEMGGGRGKKRNVGRSSGGPVRQRAGSPEGPQNVEHTQ